MLAKAELRDIIVDITVHVRKLRRSIIEPEMVDNGYWSIIGGLRYL